MLIVVLGPSQGGQVIVLSCLVLPLVLPLVSCPPPPFQVSANAVVGTTADCLVGLLPVAANWPLCVGGCGSHAVVHPLPGWLAVVGLDGLLVVQRLLAVVGLDGLLVVQTLVVCCALG